MLAGIERTPMRSRDGAGQNVVLRTCQHDLVNREFEATSNDTEWQFWSGSYPVDDCRNIEAHYFICFYYQEPSQQLC